MVYLITGKLARAEILRLPHEEYVALMKTKIAPSLQMLVSDTPNGKVIGGGVLAGSRDVAMIVDLHAHDSHRCVRQFLASLPIFEYYEWQSTPLETFAEMALAFQA
jgi:hypothetical protein